MRDLLIELIEARLVSNGMMITAAAFPGKLFPTRRALPPVNMI
jgi:hypothetical protein